MSFEEWFKKDEHPLMDCDKWTAEIGYKAGAVSRQGEVDELKKELEILQGVHNALSLEAGNLVGERDELQKRVDELIKCELVREGVMKLMVDLIDQIEMTNFSDQGGYLINNVIYIELKNRVDRVLRG